MQRGYFDDFKDFRDKKGKVFYAQDRLTPAAESLPFPAILPVAADGAETPFPPAAAAAAPPASLVCVAFRAGAQGMLEAWAAPFSAAFHSTPGAALYELALVESRVMSLWPFRSMLMSSGGKSQAKYDMPCQYLYFFKAREPLREALHMTNRLTGYVYLVDGEGRVRWRGSGNPEARELEALLKCSNQLLEDR